MCSSGTKPEHSFAHPTAPISPFSLFKRQSQVKKTSFLALCNRWQRSRGEPKPATKAPPKPLPRHHFHGQQGDGTGSLPQAQRCRSESCPCSRAEVAQLPPPEQSKSPSVEPAGCPGLKLANETWRTASLSSLLRGWHPGITHGTARHREVAAVAGSEQDIARL